MVISGSKTLYLQPSGSEIRTSPANCDVTVRVDAKCSRLAAFGFSSTSNEVLDACLFLGSISSVNELALDIHADRYDRGDEHTKGGVSAFCPEPSVCLGQDDVVIPCFMNRRVAKSELRKLSMSTLFPSVEERGFSPSLRDIIACCITLRLSNSTPSLRSMQTSIVTRADLRLSLPTNTATFIPVVVPNELFGGISVADLLPPVVYNQGRQTFRAGYISHRSASNRLASSFGFLLDTDVWKQVRPSDPALLGIWISGSNSGVNDLRVYAACIRYAFDTRLSQCRILPSLLTNYRSPPSLPFTSVGTSPFFLVAVISNNQGHAPSVDFYECRLSPALQPTFTILTATTLLPPPSGGHKQQQMVKLDFALGRAASVAVGGNRSDFLDDSGDEAVTVTNDKDNDSQSEPFSVRSSKQPRPQPPPSAALPLVPDVSVWLPPDTPNSSRSDARKSVGSLATPRIATELKHPALNLDLHSKSVADSNASSFEYEWRQIREKVELMWEKSEQLAKYQQHGVDSVRSPSQVKTMPLSDIRLSTNSGETSTTVPTLRTLQDACVGVGASLLMLNSPKMPQKQSTTETKLLTERAVEVKSATKGDATNRSLSRSDVCSQCCSRDELLSRGMTSQSGKGHGKGLSCCIFPRRQKYAASDIDYCEKDEKFITTTSTEKAVELKEKDNQYDPCSLILKWLQRCGNETDAVSSVGNGGMGVESASRCSGAECDSVVQTAAAICTYLNNDSSIDEKHKQYRNKLDSSNADVSVCSRSLLIENSVDRKTASETKYAVAASSENGGDSNAVNNVTLNDGTTESSESFAARAREIVRQMDEWGLAPTLQPPADSWVEADNSTKDTSRTTASFSQDELVGNDITLNSVRSEAQSLHSGHRSRARGKLLKQNGGNRPTISETNISMAIPRIVALDSLRLGPTDTTLVMKNLAVKHLAASESSFPKNKPPPPQAYTFGSITQR